MLRQWNRWLAVSSLLVLAGCASVYKPQNEPLQYTDGKTGYYYRTVTYDQPDDYNVMLAFSGGGTRAAALSYGVMQELRATRVKNKKGRDISLLTQVDSISSVSGGSFTAAYYGLFGQKLFTDFEKDFLRQGVQDLLIKQLINPITWITRAFQAFDRTEMAVEFYENEVFRNKTFKDMSRGQLPYIEINATDLNGGARFSFTQDMFDLICSDVSKFSVGRAVAASSAVPVVFPTVVLKNNAGQCDISKQAKWQALQSKALDKNGNLDFRKEALRERLRSYSNAKQRPYLHLVDGGIADNLALRAILERIELMGGLDEALSERTYLPKNVLVVSVNADVRPKRSIDLSARKPGLMQTVDAFTDAQMKLYNVETLSFTKQQLAQLQQELRARGKNVNIYFVEVDFQSLNSQATRDFFNALPTTLQLGNKEVDQLIAAGRDLLRNNAEFKRFVQANR